MGSGELQVHFFGEPGVKQYHKRANRCEGSVYVTRVLKISIVLSITAPTALFADELLYRYEADVLPYHPSAGWQIFDPCDQACSESLEPGHLVLSWGPPGGERHVNYTMIISDPPASPPDPPFWAEWRFASNFPATNGFNDDGGFDTAYFAVGTTLNIYGDSIFTFFGDKYVTGLELNAFRTFRIEATNQTDYCIWYDGILFTCDSGGQTNFGAAVIKMYGFGGDDPNFSWPLINRWDFVRYGRATIGETVVASDPPSGVLDAAQHSILDRFTVTFDQPNYVYVNDVTVEVIGTQARRGMTPRLSLGFRW